MNATSLKVRDRGWLGLLICSFCVAIALLLHLDGARAQGQGTSNPVSQPGKLDSQQQQQISAWLVGKCGQQPFACDMCAQRSWTMVNLTTLRPYQKGSMSIGGPEIPVVTLCCNHCGQVKMVSAMKIGVVAGK
ncbi:MAG: hypothetical protein AB7N76_33975 [Planctomycetota bacterium]